METERFSGNDIPKSEFLGKLSDDTKIYEVDGQYVRDNISVEWIGGGHCKENDFIAHGEIWVEELPDEEDEEKILVHEIVEYISMIYAGFKYDAAHELANSVEAVVRGYRCEDPENKTSEEKDVEEGAQHEFREHESVSKKEAKDMAKEHESEHPMYYDKLKKARLGKKGANMNKEGKALVMIMIGKKKPVSQGKKDVLSPNKIEATMHEFKKGILHSGSGEKVSNRKQALAIAFSQASKKS
jgi:hypothetical protein